MINDLTIGVHDGVKIGEWTIGRQLDFKAIDFQYPYRYGNILSQDFGLNCRLFHSIVPEDVLQLCELLLAVAGESAIVQYQAQAVVESRLPGDQKLQFFDILSQLRQLMSKRVFLI